MVDSDGFFFDFVYQNPEFQKLNLNASAMHYEYLVDTIQGLIEVNSIISKITKRRGIPKQVIDDLNISIGKLDIMESNITELTKEITDNAQAEILSQ